LGIPFLGKYFSRNDEANEFNKQTWIQSASITFLFQWDHGKHQQHFKHGSTYLPELLTNEGETYFTAFHTCLSKFVDDEIIYAFSLAFNTSPDGIPQPHIIPNDEDDEINKYSGTHLHMCIKMKSPINVFVSVNTQNLPNLLCMELLKLSSS
jgi:hypothetical protein